MTSRALIQPLPAWTLPLALLPALAFLAAVLPGELPLLPPRPVIPAPAIVATVPGLAAVYDPVQAVWNWRFVRRMKDGCQKLLLDATPGESVQGNLVTLSLMTYSQDAPCSLPARTLQLRGRTNAPASAHFTVRLDGEPLLR